MPRDARELLPGSTPTYQLGVRIDYRLWEAARGYARSRGWRPGRIVEEALREYLGRRGIVVEEPEPSTKRFALSSVYFRLREEEARLLAEIARRKRRRRTELVREGLYLLFEKVKREIEEEKARKAEKSGG